MTQSLEATSVIFPNPVAGQQYTLPWRILAAAEHEAILQTDVGDTVLTLVHGVDFVVSLDESAGPNEAKLTLLAVVPDEAQRLYVERATSEVQRYKATPGAEGVELALDRLTMRQQEVSTNLGRFIKTPKGTTNDVVLPFLPENAFLVGGAEGSYKAGPVIEEIGQLKVDAEAARDAAATAVAAASLLANGITSGNAAGVATGNTGQENLAALNTLLANENGRAIAFEQGIYEFSDQLQIPSGTRIFDFTFGGVVFRLSDDAPDDACLVCGPLATPENPTPAAVEDVVIIGLTLDGNHARSPTIGTQRPGGTGAAAGHIKNWTFWRTRAHGWKLHNFDICNSGELNGSDRRYSYGGNTHPSTGRSQCVNLIECESWDAGDDTITIHFADDWLVDSCLVHSASGRHPSMNGSVMIEADDGAGPGRIINNKVMGPASTGIAIKCHDGYPAPHGILVQGNDVSGVARGFYVNDPNALGPSDSAIDVNITGNRCSKPRFFDKVSGLKSDTDIAGFSIGEYTGVTVSNNVAIGDGQFLSETFTEVATTYTRQTESAFEFESSTQFICANNRAINWASNNVTDPGVCGFKTTSTAQGIMMGNMSVDCGYRGFVDTDGDTGGIMMGNLAILTKPVFPSGTPKVGFRFSTVGAGFADVIVGNRAIGPWDFALSVEEDDYASMRDFAGVTSVNSAFSATRKTDLPMTTGTDFNVAAFGQNHDLSDDFITATGTFTARVAGLHTFQATISFADGDGSDDTGTLTFLRTFAGGGDEVFGDVPINPRRNSGSGVEDVVTISADVVLDIGDDVNLRILGMSSDTPVIAKIMHFNGRSV